LNSTDGRAQRVLRKTCDLQIDDLASWVRIHFRQLRCGWYSPYLDKHNPTTNSAFTLHYDMQSDVLVQKEA